ncbi:hypothetical protein F66182_1906 [Fusarium sp. NRRL 66182]|nr:hypothetical protein F66182_1906 [Fusarium sp. NRRL 66182]
MPGVPKSKGCKNCHKQKKRCDEAKPACSRCVRLNIPCMGAGEQRYVFKPVSFQNATKPVRKPSKRIYPAKVPILHKPQSPLSVVQAKFVAALQMTDIRYSLGCYGDFLEHIPKRLGHSEVLDASAKAMIDALPYHYTQDLPPDALASYISALKELRVSLGSAETKLKPETLSTIYIIMICQGWIGRTDDCVKSHGEILAHLANSAIGQNWTDTFELRLLETLFVPLILEAMVNPAITMEPWFTFIDSCLLQPPYETRQEFKVLSLQAQKLVRMPVFFHKPFLHQAEIMSTYGELRDDHPRIQQYLQSLKQEMSNHSDQQQVDCLKETRKEFHRFRVLDGVLLTVVIPLNSLLRTLYPEDNALFLEAESLTNEFLALAEDAAQYRPLGASYIPPCLAAVWATTSAFPDQQAKLATLMAEYQPDFPSVRWMDQAVWLKSSHKMLLSQLTGAINNDEDWYVHGELDTSMVHCKAAFGPSGSCLFI